MRTLVILLLILRRLVGDIYISAGVHRYFWDGQRIGIRDEQGADAVVVDPSLQVFLELVSRYHISVDQILYGNEAADKSTERRQFELLLDELTDAEIKILTATAQAILDARADSEGEN